MKAVKGIFLISVSILSAVLIYRRSLPVQVMAIYQDNNFTDILVKDFPLSEHGKREWWGTNKDKMEKEFDFPKKDAQGRYRIIIWSFGDGYKKMPNHDNRLSTETSDLLCFETLKKEANCIDKKRLMTIEKNLNGPELITVQ
ncbi:DUF943 family protein [uncultured Pluralibacter sp.]|uniref:DUF943 family protein n=1 Tax=uncultured Pluralibacter sp. TaxID=1490864 RepID=UPI002608D039|nr:DUF943 family protein [uncultured Pluralibacter sp.]